MDRPSNRCPAVWASGKKKKHCTLGPEPRAFFRTFFALALLHEKCFNSAGLGANFIILHEVLDFFYPWGAKFPVTKALVKE